MNKLNYDTFRSLIKVVGASLEQKNTHMKENINFETRVT